MKLVDKVYGYKKAEQYYTSHNIDELSDELKVIIITTEMLRDIFLFLAAGYGFCSFVFFFELNICKLVFEKFKISNSIPTPTQRTSTRVHFSIWLIAGRVATHMVGYYSV